MDTRTPAGDDPVPVSAGARSAALGAAGDGIRLPVLRRPPGWSLLEESAVRVRAASLYHACVPRALADDAARPNAARLPLNPGKAPAKPPGQAPAAVTSHGVPTTSDDSAAIAPAPRLAALTAHRTALATGAHSWVQALPWLVAGAGLLLITPWLVWAPLAGGLCLGILLLQTGLLRRWLARRQSAIEQAQAPDPFGQRLAAEGAPMRSAWKHSGWLLTAALALIGVQAAMLIATVQIRRGAESTQRGAGAESSGARSPTGAAEAADRQAADREASAPAPLRLTPGAMTIRPGSGPAERDRQAEPAR